MEVLVIRKAITKINSHKTVFQEKQLLAEVQETKSEAIVDSSENEKSEEAMYESEEIPFQESENNEETTEVIKEKSILLCPNFY